MTSPSPLPVTPSSPDALRCEERRLEREQLSLLTTIEDEATGPRFRAACEASLADVQRRLLEIDALLYPRPAVQRRAA